MIHHKARRMPHRWRADAWEALRVFAWAERHEISVDGAGLGDDDLLRLAAFQPCLDVPHFNLRVVGGGLGLGQCRAARRFLRLA